LAKSAFLCDPQLCLSEKFTSLKEETRGVSHIVALPFYIKKNIKAKEKYYWKLKYFTMQNINLQKKNSSKRNQL